MIARCATDGLNYIYGAICSIMEIMILLALIKDRSNKWNSTSKERGAERWERGFAKV